MSQSVATEPYVPEHVPVPLFPEQARCDALSAELGSQPQLMRRIPETGHVWLAYEMGEEAFVVADLQPDGAVFFFGSFPSLLLAHRAIEEQVAGLGQ